MSHYADPAHRYRLDSRIAVGGMGEVWKATDTVLNRVVAVKLLKAEYADDPAFRTRFETEARNAAALHHPNVAAVFDFGGEGDEHRPFLVMELVDGQPLSALLRRGRQMPAEQAQHLLGQAADALAAAHKAGIVHRDVKPANLLVTPDRQLKITDFGIARAADGMALTQTGQVMGTPQYLSPEQAEGRNATPASDVYSLGCVLFECLAGRRPYTAESPVATALAHVREPVPELPLNVPADLAAVVRRCLAKDPKNRYRDAAEFATALRNPPPAPTVGADAERTAVLSGVVPGLPPARSVADEPGTLATPVPPPRRGVPWWALAVPILLLVGLVAWAVWDNANNDPGPASTDDETSQLTTPTTPTTEPPDETIFVDADDYIGEPVDEVEAKLEALGFEVDRDEEANPGDETQGIVTALAPEGDLERGETIQVTFWGPAPETSAPPTTATAEPTETGTIPTITPDITTTGPGNGRKAKDDR